MFSKRLKELRKENNLTQEEISKKLNISRQAYANWESGRSEPSIGYLLALSNFFNVSIDYLCCNTTLRNSIKDELICKYINKCMEAYHIIKDKD